MKVLAFGEILWDVYPQRRVIGGATLNFAGSFAALGGEAAILSCVGTDELGDESLETVREMKIDDTFVGRTETPTGQCLVTVDSFGNPSYELCYPVSYDRIAYDERISSADFDALYFGTLAQRDAFSGETLRKTADSNSFKHIIYDINIRQSWYDRDTVEYGLRLCDILKISREEAWVFEELGLVTPERCMDERSKLELLSRYLSSVFDIATVLVTLDKDGAFVFDRGEGRVIYSEKPRVKVVSTVGGGDSFSAAYLFFKMRGDSPETALNKAVKLSSYVVSRIESVPPIPDCLLDELLG